MAFFESGEKKKFQKILDLLLPFLKEHHYHSGSFLSGKEEELKLVQLGRNYLYVTETEYLQESLEIANKKEEYSKKEGNILLGFLGLLLAAPFGMALYVLVGKLGNFYYFCFSSLVAMGACYIYKFLSGKLSKNSFLLIFFFLVSILVLSNFVEFSWWYYDVLREEYDVTFLESMEETYLTLLEDGDVLYDFIIGFLLDFLISVGITVYILYREYKKELQSLESKKLNK